MLTPEMQSRLEQIIGRTLGEGSHESLDEGLCVMEAVSFVAGEPWTDTPQCACPVIGAFMRSWNDGLPNDADRDRLLKPLVPRLVGSKATPAIEERRAFLAMDWVIRVWTPKFLELVPSLAHHAEKLRALEEIADTAGLVAAGEHLGAARTDVAAARDATWAAAWDAAWAAARAAAWAAARDAAWAAAWDAAWDAAWAAARAAARAAAWAAAWAAGKEAALKQLQPTVEWLQTSALDLVERMLALQPEQQQVAA